VRDPAVLVPDGGGMVTMAFILAIFGVCIAALLLARDGSAK
jgi:hypothetical protein